MLFPSKAKPITFVLDKYLPRGVIHLAAEGRADRFIERLVKSIRPTSSSPSATPPAETDPATGSKFL
jgi:hypothetical protein